MVIVQTLIFYIKLWKYYF